MHVNNIAVSIIGAYEGFKSGHALNNTLVRALLAQPEAYEIVSFDDATAADVGITFGGTRG